jgi:hypothetical protein
MPLTAKQQQKLPEGLKRAILAKKGGKAPAKKVPAKKPSMKPPAMKMSPPMKSPKMLY